jgi:hypothetical protein
VGAEESGWGATRFEQSGSRVNGAMGNYSARGVVRGPRLFLALSSGGLCLLHRRFDEEGRAVKRVLFFLGSFQSGRSDGCHAPACWPVGHKHQPGAKQTARRGKRQRRAFSARRSGHPNSWGVAQAAN